MGLAVEHLTKQRREAIARDLFEVKNNLGDELHGLCRFHDDTEPSFSYNFVKDTYFCLACGAKGDLVALWCHVYGHDPKVDGVRRFKEAFGIEQPWHPGLPWENDKPKKKRPHLHVVKDESTDKIIDESKILSMPSLDQRWVEQLARDRGWSQAVIDILGIRQYENGRGEARIAIPVRDVRGDLVNIRMYLPGAAKNKMISWSEKGPDGKKVAYGSSRLFPSPADWGPGRVWLCEGEPDVIRALTAGLNAVTQTAGANSFKKDFLKEFKGREVVIVYDADKPGIENAHKRAEQLKEHAKLVRVVEWPAYMADEDGGWPDDHGQDLTDFFQEHGKTVADLENLLASATVYEKDPEPEVSAGARRFMSGRKFKPRLLADAMLDDLSVLADPQTGLLYRWTGKYYKPWHFERLEAYALKMLLDEGEPARASSAARMVYLDSLLPEDQELNDNADLVCLDTGMVYIGADSAKFGELMRHDKKFRCTQILPYAFNPNAECPRWIKFLEEVIPDPLVRAQLQEFFGYCLTRETRYAKALILKGPGSDGKSKILNILQAVVGAENCSAVQMGRLDDPFERATIHNKLLNVAAEEGKKAFGSEWFKAIASGDLISASYKHKDFFEFRPYCKLAFATNFWPAVTDNTDGYWRRILPIEFTKQFGKQFGTDEDKHLEEKLLAELPGIFLWSMAGLQMLREQGDFTEAETTNRILQQYKTHNNPLVSFVEEYCVIEDGARVGKDELFDRYKKIITSWNNFPLNKQNFGSGLNSVVRGLKDGRLSVNDPDNPRAKAYVGIRLRNKGELLPPAPPSVPATSNGLSGQCPGVSGFDSGMVDS
ncbi:phage/plasmid primase, P4 family [Desulfuromonas acetoxidans]|uniref:phage/plasmid primase, P4 family n=1 Tax=Desulfuromonas acetoxidans TaxID=891 RepID=UPI00292DD91B|nr:phage/plasmid primase, P4 family [Desulfuromonas acetoxidans]